MGREIRQSKEFRLTKAQAGYFIWGQFDPERQAALNRAGFDDLEHALHFYFNNRDEIKKHLDQMDARTEQVDQEWQNIAFQIFCGGKFCGKGCNYKKKDVAPFDHGQPQDQEWTEGDPDDYALVGG